MHLIAEGSLNLVLLVSSLGNMFVRSCRREKHDITLTSEGPVKDRCTLKSFYHNNGVTPCHVASNNYTLNVTKPADSSVYHVDINNKGKSYPGDKLIVTHVVQCGAKGLFQLGHFK